MYKEYYTLDNHILVVLFSWKSCDYICVKTVYKCENKNENKNENKYENKNEKDYKTN